MKSAAEVQRLSAMQVKQAAVLKRKTEEAEMARKRLREVGAGAKATAKKLRDTMAATLAKQDSKTEDARRQWVEKELESCNQASCPLLAPPAWLRATQTMERRMRGMQRG